MKLYIEELLNIIINILADYHRNCLLVSRLYAVRYLDSRSSRQQSFQRVKDLKYQNKLKIENKITTNKSRVML